MHTFFRYLTQVLEAYKAHSPVSPPYSASLFPPGLMSQSLAALQTMYALLGLQGYPPGQSSFLKRPHPLQNSLNPAIFSQHHQLYDNFYQRSLDIWSDLVKINLDHYERSQFDPLNPVDHDRHYEITLELEQSEDLRIRIVGDDLRIRQSVPNAEQDKTWSLLIPTDVDRERIRAERIGQRVTVTLPKHPKKQQEVQDIIIEHSGH